MQTDVTIFTMQLGTLALPTTALLPPQGGFALQGRLASSGGILGLITLEELGSWHPGGGSQGYCSTIPQYTDSTQLSVTLASNVTGATWRNPDPYNKRFNLILSFFLEYSMVFYFEGLELEYKLKRGKRQSPFRIFFFFSVKFKHRSTGFSSWSKHPQSLRAVACVHS